MRLILTCIAMIVVSWPTVGMAQELTDLIPQGRGVGETSIQLISLLTVLSLAPGILIMITCFPFMVIVLAILRQGIGLQQSPPNMMLVSLALFLTYFVMEPVFAASWETGVRPMIDNSTSLFDAFGDIMAPFQSFMNARAAPDIIMELQNLRANTEQTLFDSETSLSLSVLIPGFMLSEIERAFQVGFFILIPFMIIDLLVAAILMSMGMMMVPPVVVSLPFKLAFFVVADGWGLIASGLVKNYI